MRIYGISDLHVDFAPNLEQVASLPVGPHRGDTLLVAGDICHRMDRAEQALGLVPAGRDDMAAIIRERLEGYRRALAQRPARQRR